MIASTRPPSLSLREKAAQVLFVDLRFDKPDYEDLGRLARAGIGGVCFFGGSVFDIPPTVNSLQNVARVPLLICADHEHGVGYQVRGATALPTNMAVGATTSADLANLKGRVTAREARSLGVPWILAPVADVQSNPKNPIINVRSFGEDPALAGRLAAAFARGVREGGGLSCLKHFPGHGDVTQDSHLVLPRVSADAATLRARELRPFQEALAEADAVMTAHLLVEAFDRERPASLSRAVTTDLLRREMKFDGLIVTDALMMGAVRNLANPQEPVIRALEAGADIALYPEGPWEAIDAVTKAVQSGRLPEQTLDAAIERIWAAKCKAGVIASPTVDVAAAEGVVDSVEHRDAAKRIAEAAITLAFDRSKTLPLAQGVRYAAMRDDSARGDLTLFEKALADRGRLQGDSHVGVLAIFSKYRSFSGRTEADTRLIEDARLSLGPISKLVVVSFGNPYVIGQIPGAAAYVCAYGEAPCLQVAAARSLCGEIPFLGKLPVTLDCP